MLEDVITKIVPYDDKYSLNDDEKEIFLKDGKCLTFSVKDSSETYIGFLNTQDRLKFVQLYLAYYVNDIRKQMENNKDHIISLNFEGDVDIFRKCMDPEDKNYKIFSKSDCILKYNFLNKTFDAEVFSPHLTVVVVAVTVPGTETLYNFEMYQVDLFQIFYSVERPYTLDNRTIFLTGLEKLFFLSPTTNTKFYLDKDSYEPIILNKDVRDNIISKMLESIKDTKTEDQIYHIQLKNGDRDLVKVLAGIPLPEDLIKVEEKINLVNHKLYEKFSEYKYLIDYYGPSSKALVSSELYA